SEKPKLQELGVDNLYVAVEDKDIASYWSLNSLTKFADLEGSLFISKKGVRSVDDKNGFLLEDIADGKRYLVRRFEDGLEAYRVANGVLAAIGRVYDYDKEYVYNSSSSEEDCFYSGKYYYYLNKKMCNTLGFRMLVGKDTEGVKKFYSTPTFKIYEILPPAS
ncbi:MAG: hypothetical protein AABX69_02850, partial [Nanoarchaeota archaeon]